MSAHNFALGDGPPASFRRLVLPMVGIFGLFLVLIVFAGIHFLGSDDVTYWAGGQGWLHHFPFIVYRINNSFHHDSTINRLLSQGEGLPLVNPFIDPFILLAFSHYFGALFWVAIPLGIWLLRNRSQSVRPASAVQLIGGVSLVWFVLAGLSFKLLPLMPRYFMISVVGGCMIAALGLTHLWSGRRPVLAGSLLALLLLCNAGGLLVENRNYMFGEWELLDVASRNAGLIHTDPLTLRRAKLLLQWHGLDDRVTADPAKSGDLFLWNPPRAGRDYAPQPSWTRLEDFQPKVPLTRRLLQDVPSRLLPAELRNKFGAGHPGVALYKAQ